MNRVLQLKASIVVMGLIILTGASVSSCRDTFSAEPLPEVQIFVTVTDSGDVLLAGSTVRITTSENETYEGLTDVAGHWKSPQFSSSRTHAYVYSPGIGSEQMIYNHDKEDPDKGLGAQLISWVAVVGPTE